MDDRIGGAIAAIILAVILAVDVWVLLTKDSIAAQSLALGSMLILLPILVLSLKSKLSKN